MDYLQYLIALLILAAAVCLPRRLLPPGDDPARRWERCWLFRRAHRVVLAVFVFSLLLNIGFASCYQVPVPWVHDEFAYLLAGDTFAGGRLTNETHPMWKHLESFHVFHTPSYQAKYPPGQGVFLALGQVLTGAPAVGVWLSLALACAAVGWMLLAVFPPLWSMVGGLLVAVSPPIVMKWGQSYWGGAVAMLGGALMFGALFRLRRRVAPGDAVVLALGVVILANTRPYEGLLVAIPSGIYALYLLAHWSRTSGWRPVVFRFVLPVCALLIVSGAGMLFYNYRLVGDPWTLPYSHYRTQASHHELIRGYTGSPPHSLSFKFLRFWLFYLGPLLTIAFIPLKSIVSRRESCLALLLTLLVFSASALTSRAWPHYTAPVACLVYVVVVQGLIALTRIEWRGRRAGALLARAVPIAFVVSSALLFAGLVHQGPETLWAHQRQAIVRDLEKGDDRHLVLVQYSPDHFLHKEWVYNRADIDGADIVWAREMSPAENRELLRYFKDRRKWLLLADEDPAILIPITEATAAAGGE